MVYRAKRSAIEYVSPLVVSITVNIHSRQGKQQRKNGGGEPMSDVVRTPLRAVHKKKTVEMLFDRSENSIS